MVRVKQGGFTLIELVVVIVILGILAAFAVPRFMGLENEARVASVSALEGTIRSSAALAHGLWLASGSPATIVVEGVTITMVNGYPNLATIDDTLAPGTIVTTGAAGRYAYTQATGQFRLNGARDPANCRVSYAAATGPNLAPLITPVVAGCR